jgi:hypothetical protein
MNNEENNNVNIIEKKYENILIEFFNDDNIYINATKVAKQFGKEVRFWLRLDQTKAYIKAYEELQKEEYNRSADHHFGKNNDNKIQNKSIVIIKKGGNDKHNQGTWIHKDLIISFAQWINPKFAVWCNKQIEEIIKGNYVHIDQYKEVVNTLVKVGNNYNVLADFSKHAIEEAFINTNKYEEEFYVPRRYINEFKKRHKFNERMFYDYAIKKGYVKNKYEIVLKRQVIESDKVKYAPPNKNTKQKSNLFHKSIFEDCEKYYEKLGITCTQDYDKSKLHNLNETYTGNLTILANALEDLPHLSQVINKLTDQVKLNNLIIKGYENE